MDSATAKTTATFVGRPIQRVEDFRLLRGEGQYVDDHNCADQLHAAIFRSSIAHGRIRRIDVSAARSMAGVHAVLTAQDLGGAVPVISTRAFPSREMELFFQPVLAHDKVRYVGEPLAVVVADTPAIAEDALALIDIEIDELPTSALLFEERQSNDAFRYACRRGDAAGSIAAAPYRRRERLSVQRHTGITMETRGILAAWAEETHSLTVWGASKVPFANRRLLAAMMALPETSIQMIEGDAGGSFGVRGEFFAEDFLIPFAARRLGRPVKWVEDRREHLLAISHARDVVCDLEIACSHDGIVQALLVDAVVDTGAYFRTTTTIGPRNIAQFIAGPYHVPNYAADITVRLSNKSPSGVYRAPGRFESDFFRERMFDIAARDLGIDQVEFRRRNLIARDALPYAVPDVSPGPAPTELDSGDYAHVMDLCLRDARWAEKQPLQGQLIEEKYHGLAVGCFIEGGAAGPHENARIAIEADGTASVYVGSSAVGQGVQTVMTQIAADALQLPLESIRVFHGSTTYVSSGIGSFHSRSTVMGGNAVAMAAAEIIKMGCAAAASLLQCSAEDVDYGAGAFTSRFGASVTFADLSGSKLAYEATFKNSKNTYTYGAHVAHVAVDPRTGQIEIVDYVGLEDVGKIVNPLTMHGQTIGSIVQGLGGTLLEHFIYDENGQLLSGSLADYLVPLATDFPNIRSHTLELYPSPNNPLGAKGAGEGGIIPVGGLIANAVAAALANIDVQPFHLPLTPDRVWTLIETAQGARTSASRMVASP